MTALACYRLQSQVRGREITDFNEVLADPDDAELRSYGPLDGDDFSAMLYVVNGRPSSPSWAALLREGFGPDIGLETVTSPAALLVVKLQDDNPAMFAFAFGYGGRFLIRDDLYMRGYGLRVCLNLLQPREADSDESPLIRAMRSKRRGATVIRSDVQASTATGFQTFNVNRLRDVITAATGTPTDLENWGRRISGGDAVNVDLDVSLDEIGALCRRLDATYGRNDYKDGFGWIDDIQPVTHPVIIDRLEEEVLDCLVRRDFDSLRLAPPQHVDWDRVSGFRFAFDEPGGRRNRKPVIRPDLRIEDYANGLGQVVLADLDITRLRRTPVFAIDTDGHQIHRWTVWRSLVGELQLDGDAYVLDEGEFFAVDEAYLAALNRAVDEIPTSPISLPPTRVGTKERAYKRFAAERDSKLLFLDFKLVGVEDEPGRIELCDLLSMDGELIHVKRDFGSSGLSHLFSQGVVSAALLQENIEFRCNAQASIDSEAGNRAENFAFFSDATIATRALTIAYAIIGRWTGRSASKALPFFSKVNLREAYTNLRSRDYRVALVPVEATLLNPTDPPG